MVLAEAVVPKSLIWRLGVDQYHAMIEAGILTADDAVELLEGLLVVKMPKKPAHRAATKLLRTILEQMVRAGWYVDSQEPITLSDSEPEPDVVVVRGDTRQYLDRHPGPDDLGLVVEVSDSTVKRDQDVKKRAYARAGIGLYWIINLASFQVEVYTQPGLVDGEPSYLREQIFAVGSAIELVIDGERWGWVAVSDILP
ncbi:MAG: Uma2 family endonuclease [Synechococcales cyanobacterium RM1_1_8]|nr:Uma2 family endonuclease [Synechococcales cyanobacterium RM1_1_8]